MKRTGRKALLSLLIGVVLLVTTEVTFRQFETRWVHDPARLAELRHFVYAGQPKGLFEPRPHTVFGRPRNETANGMKSNSLGFFDDEWVVAKTPGVPRIICLGSSTTETGHPVFLEEMLEKRTHHDFQVYNAGISGWTTAETLVSYFLLVQDYAPDLIVLHDAINDVGAQAVPGYRSDYTHYRHSWDPPSFPAWQQILVRTSHFYSWLALDGSAPDIAQFTTRQLRPGESAFDGQHFPEGTDYAYRRNLCTIAEHARAHGSEVLVMTMPLMPSPSDEFRKRNAHWYVGVAECNRIVRGLAAERGWMLADAEQSFERTPELATHFLDIAHLDHDGNRAKAQLIVDVLVEHWIPILAAQRAAQAATPPTPAASAER